jgi:hypothetical protein
VKYAVLVITGDASQRLGDALAGHYVARKVYVVGMSDETAFARSLAGDAVSVIEMDELDSSQALAFTMSEAIGTEDRGASFSELMEAAKRRARQLQEGR